MFSRNDPGNTFHAAPYAHGFSGNTVDSQQLSNQNNYLDIPPASDFLNFTGITIDGGGPSLSSSTKAEHLPVVGSMSDLPFSPSSSFRHNTGTSNHLSRVASTDAVLPGLHSRTEHGPQYQHHQRMLPLTGPDPSPQARGYPMHSFESPSFIGTSGKEQDFKKNPQAMRNFWIADYSHFLDKTKVLKVFSKNAKEKVATINTLKASAARRKGPAKFKCPIEACGADFTRKHNLESQSYPNLSKRSSHTSMRFLIVRMT